MAIEATYTQVNEWWLKRSKLILGYAKTEEGLSFQEEALLWKAFRTPTNHYPMVKTAPCLNCGMYWGRHSGPRCAVRLEWKLPGNLPALYTYAPPVKRWS